MYEYAKLKHLYLGQVVQNLRIASVAYDPEIYIEQAIQNVLDLKTAAAALSDFENFVKDRTFLNPKTKNEVKFESLPPDSQKKIRLEFKKKFEKSLSNRSIGENVVSLLKGFKGEEKSFAESIMNVKSSVKDFFTDPKKRKEMINKGLDGIKNISSEVIDRSVSFLKKEFAVEEVKTAFKLFTKDPTDGQKFIDDDGNEIPFEKLSMKEKYRWREKKVREIVPKLMKASAKVASLIAFGVVAYKGAGLLGVAASTATSAKVAGSYMVKGIVKDTVDQTIMKTTGLSKLELDTLKGVQVPHITPHSKETDSKETDERKGFLDTLKKNGPVEEIQTIEFDDPLVITPSKEFLEKQNKDKDNNEETGLGKIKHFFEDMFNDKETDKKETDKKETDKKETDKKETDEKKETDKKETDEREKVVMDLVSKGGIKALLDHDLNDNEKKLLDEFGIKYQDDEGDDEEEEEVEDEEESEKQQMSVSKKMKRKDIKKLKQQKNKTAAKKSKKDDDKAYSDFFNIIRREMMNTLIDKKWHSKEFFDEVVNSCSKAK